MNLQEGRPVAPSMVPADRARARIGLGLRAGALDFKEHTWELKLPLT